MRTPGHRSGGAQHFAASVALSVFLVWPWCAARAEGADAVDTIGLRSLVPPALLPDGKEFKTWDRPLTFTKTYHVNGAHPQAADDGPGSEAQPFKTIDRAAQVLQPGERVVVAAGEYREWVRPRRGGTGPEAMISYQAAPGAKVVIKGSRVLKAKWEAAAPAGAAKVWSAALPAELFDGYNPFKEENINAQQFEWMDWARPQKGKAPYTLPPALVFQDGKRLEQAATREALEKTAGAFWVTDAGKTLHVRTLGDSDPNGATIEVTTQRCVFAPETMGLGYIHVQGFTIEHAGNAFPMPQYGAISTWRGHHWLIEDNTVRWANSVGIDFGNQIWVLPQPPLIGHHIVRRNTVTDCGVCGLAGLHSVSCLVEDNVLRRNAFHNVEHYYETGAIKMHLNENTLIRHNLIVDTLHGPGIWMDFANVNSRCARNIVLRTSTIHGGIFIEASSKLNMLDHNVIWDTKGNGIYEHDSRGQIFAHNIIGQSTKAGIMLRGKVTDRKVHGQPIVGGEHTVANNVLIGNGKAIEEHGPKSTLEGNVTEKATATLDPDKVEMTWWSVEGQIPEGRRLDVITHDFFGQPRMGAAVQIGPFIRSPSTPERISLWPAATEANRK